MKKNKFLYIALMLIPLVAVGIAVNPGSVMVSDGKTLYTTSFMVSVEDCPVGWFPAAALILTYVVFGMTVLWGFLKKDFWRKGIAGASFLAMLLTVGPILMGGDVLVVPNVFVAILLGAECIISYVLGRKPGAEAEEPAGKRLQHK